MKKSEQLRARVLLWRQRADALELEAQQLEAQERQDEVAAALRALEAGEAKARKAINDWSAPRIRERMQEIRQMQRKWLNIDNMDRARALDKLFELLRKRAEGIELEQIKREVYTEWSGEEAERRIEVRWEEHRRNL